MAVAKRSKQMSLSALPAPNTVVSRPEVHSHERDVTCHTYLRVQTFGAAVTPQFIVAQKSELGNVYSYVQLEYLNLERSSETKQETRHLPNVRMQIDGGDREIEKASRLGESCKSKEMEMQVKQEALDLGKSGQHLRRGLSAKCELSQRREVVGKKRGMLRLGYTVHGCGGARELGSGPCRSTALQLICHTRAGKKLVNYTPSEGPPVFYSVKYPREVFRATLRPPSITDQLTAINAESGRDAGGNRSGISPWHPSNLAHSLARACMVIPGVGETVCSHPAVKYRLYWGNTISYTGPLDNVSVGTEVLGQVPPISSRKIGLQYSKSSIISKEKPFWTRREYLTMLQYPIQRHPASPVQLNAVAPVILLSEDVWRGLEQNRRDLPISSWTVETMQNLEKLVQMGSPTVQRIRRSRALLIMEDSADLVLFQMIRRYLLVSIGWLDGVMSQVVLLLRYSEASMLK
ncbi:hypothetical protein C8J56DRAFT_888730 [Mycena floridula]|nr:hypothetical protein C8J56DRAFT_888730 [Mycena floridula]